MCRFISYRTGRECQRTVRRGVWTSLSLDWDRCLVNDWRWWWTLTGLIAAAAAAVHTELTEPSATCLYECTSQSTSSFVVWLDDHRNCQSFKTYQRSATFQYVPIAIKSALQTLKTVDTVIYKDKTLLTMFYDSLTCNSQYISRLYQVGLWGVARSLKLLHWLKCKTHLGLNLILVSYLRFVSNIYLSLYIFFTYFQFDQVIWKTDKNLHQVWRCRVKMRFRNFNLKLNNNNILFVYLNLALAHCEI